MKLISTFAVHSGAVVATVLATPTDVDWKYAVGWDGVTLPALAIGTPLDSTSSDTTITLEKRNVGGVYICSDINWGGNCGYAVQPLKKCIVLGTDWNNQISSFGPDACTVCNAYDDNNCGASGGSQWQFVNPGDASGGIGGVFEDGPWNDLISSFECFGETFC